MASTSAASKDINLSDPRSESVILEGLPMAVKALLPILAQSCTVPFLRVVSMADMGTLTLRPVFVEFQAFSTTLPPVDNTLPTVKSAGAVRSKMTRLLFVVDVTVSPSFPARSANEIPN